MQCSNKTVNGLSYISIFISNYRYTIDSDDLNLRDMVSNMHQRRTFDKRISLLLPLAEDSDSKDLKISDEEECNGGLSEVKLLKLENLELHLTSSDRIVNCKDSLSIVNEIINDIIDTICDRNTVEETKELSRTCDQNSTNSEKFGMSEEEFVDKIIEENDPSTCNKYVNDASSLFELLTENELKVRLESDEEVFEVDEADDDKLITSLMELSVAERSDDDMSPRFSCNSEASASQLQENLEDTLPECEKKQESENNVETMSDDEITFKAMSPKKDDDFGSITKSLDEDTLSDFEELEESIERERTPGKTSNLNKLNTNCVNLTPRERVLINNDKLNNSVLNDSCTTPNRCQNSPSIQYSPSIVFKDSFSPTLKVKDMKDSPLLSTPTRNSPLKTPLSNITTKRVRSCKSGSKPESKDLGLDITFSAFSQSPKSQNKCLMEASFSEPSLVDSPSVYSPLSYIKSHCSSLGQLDTAFMDPDTPEGERMMYEQMNKKTPPVYTKGTPRYPDFFKKTILHSEQLPVFDLDGCDTEDVNSTGNDNLYERTAL